MDVFPSQTNSTTLADAKLSSETLKKTLKTIICVLFGDQQQCFIEEIKTQL